MFRPLATSSLALILGAAPLLAQVTPAEVWDNLSASYAEMGYQVTAGSRDESGDALSLGDILISSETSTAEVRITVPAIVLTRDGDEVVTVIEGQMIAELTGDTGLDDTMTAQIVIDMPDNALRSSGSPEDMLHRVSYPEVLIAGRLGDDAVETPVTLTMTALAGDYRIRKGDQDQSETSYDLATEALNLDLALSDLGDTQDEDGNDLGGGKVAANARIENVKMTGTMIVPAGEHNIAENPHPALRAGMALQAGMTSGPITGSAAFSGEDIDGATQSGSASFGADGSTLTVGMSQAGLRYEGSAQGSRTEFTSSDLPFPVSYAIEAASGALVLPIAKSDMPQPFRLAYALTGLTLSDDIWGMFDPAGQLPRDPASLAVDIEGEALVSDDIMDPAFAERMAGAAEAIEEAEGTDAGAGLPSPFVPSSVRINRVALDAVGAKAEVTGDLTFPNGADQPVGTVQGDFDGINGLLDTLVAMGLVPQDQVMGARMMMAMFARPAEGNPERLQTTLELREDGSIFANGQQVK